MYDEKREYLIKTFSRTKRKDYENYILTAIWHRLQNSNIQPVTQQYVRLNDGKFALIDLYFPQLNIGVECDEEYHLLNKVEDSIRELSIVDKLSSIVESNDFELHHIRAYDSLDEIEKQINNVVIKINERINKTPIGIWTGDNNSVQLAMMKGIISVKDNFTFNTIVEICKCFSKDVKGMQRSYFSISDCYQIWCPKLSKYVNGVPVPGSKGWVNILADDWGLITESNCDKKTIDSYRAIKSFNKQRITFGKSKDVLGRDIYRFIGIFQIDKTENNSNYYKRVSEDIYLNL